MSDTMEMERFCLKCQEETLHILHYSNGLLKEGRCTNCGSIFRNRVKLLEVYGEQFMKRVLTKPMRLAAELREHPKETILGLPGRVIRKPFKEASKIAHLLEKEEQKKEEATEDTEEDGADES